MNKFFRKILVLAFLCGLLVFDLKAPSNREVVDAFKAYFTQVYVDLENESINDRNAVLPVESHIPLIPTEGRPKTTEELETKATSVLFQRCASTLCPTMGPVNQAVTEFQQENLTFTEEDISRAKGFVDSVLHNRLWIYGADDSPCNFIVGHTTLMMGLALGLVVGVSSFLPEIKRRYRKWKNNNKKCTGIGFEIETKQEKLSRRMLIARFVGAGLTILSVIELFLLRNYSIERAKKLEVDKSMDCFDSSGSACHYLTETGESYYCKPNSFNYLSYIPLAFIGFLMKPIYRSL